MMHQKDNELPVKEQFKSLQLGRQHFYNELKTDQILDQPIISLKVAVVLCLLFLGWVFFWFSFDSLCLCFCN